MEVNENGRTLQGMGTGRGVEIDQKVYDVICECPSISPSTSPIAILTFRH